MKKVTLNPFLDIKECWWTINEEPTKELFFDQLFDNVEYEVPYYDLGVDNGIITNRRTKLDALVDGYKAFEYKKTHILYNNGGYNEYCLKSLLSPLASENFINPNNGRSVANQSVADSNTVPECTSAGPKPEGARRGPGPCRRRRGASGGSCREGGRRLPGCPARGG